MKVPAAAPGIKFKFNMRLHKTVGKALKAELAAAKKAKKATKAVAATPKIKFNMKIHMSPGEIAAMKATKAVAKDGKKAKDPKKDDANNSKKDRNDAQGVLDSKVEDCIEKTLSNLSIDQV